MASKAMFPPHLKPAAIRAALLPPVSVAEVSVEPVVEPVTEPVVEPVTEPVVEPVTEPVVEPVTEPVAEPVTEVSVEVPPESVVAVPEPIVAQMTPPEESEKWTPFWKKADLLALAISKGLEVNEESTKNEIVAALKTLV